MDYWELLDIIGRAIPRSNSLFDKQERNKIKEKGRKANYHQFDLVKNSMESIQSLLNKEEMKSFIEVSLRASACPMPLNLDVWDGLLCPYGCKYCFADSFRSTLYSAFFDNYKTLGLRECKPEFFKKELGKLLTVRGKEPGNYCTKIQRAVAMEIPMRMGIRFENFIRRERKSKTALEMLKFLADEAYPMMINTKSDIVGEDEYIKELQRNKGKTAVHVTLISTNDELTKKLEPGAPGVDARFETMRNLTSAGIRVVARIEPLMAFVNDKKEEVDEYISMLKLCSVKHITFDTFSYSALDPKIRSNFIGLGIDFDRMFAATADSQGIGSLLLEKFMDYFREHGFSCSTFDLGNMPKNDQTICCEVGDVFENFNNGSIVSAIRFIIERGAKPTSWGDFEKFVMSKKGFLSDGLKMDAKKLWNYNNKSAYSPNWSPGIMANGQDKDGMVWSYIPNNDFRIDNILKSIM